jgi:hypothetical protein
MAKGAVEAGHTVEAVRQGHAALIFNETIAANMQPAGLPSLKDLFFARENQIPVFG